MGPAEDDRYAIPFLVQRSCRLGGGCGGGGGGGAISDISAMICNDSDLLERNVS